MSRNLGVQGTDETGSHSPLPITKLSIDTGGLGLGVRMGLSVRKGSPSFRGC